MADDRNKISESQLFQWIQKRQKNIEVIAHDLSRLNHLLIKSKNWLDRFRNSLDIESLQSLSTMFRMVNAWISGKYTDISSSTLLTIITALLYFVSPIDLVPDFIPGVGFLDDIFLIGLCVNRIASELNKFRAFERIESSAPQFENLAVHEIRNVIIVPGWFTEFNPCDPEKNIFQRIYPKAQITVLNWESNISWEEACQNVEYEASDNLLNCLTQLSGKTVLVGHSLGGRIITRSIAKLSRNCNRPSNNTSDNNTSSDKTSECTFNSITSDRLIKAIDHIILMGAAIDRDDEDLATYALLKDVPVYNFYRKTDRILGYLYQTWEQKSPLGLLGSQGNLSNFYDIKIAGTEEYLLEVTKNISLLVSLFGTKANFVNILTNTKLISEVKQIQHHSFTEYVEFYFHCIDERSK